MSDGLQPVIDKELGEHEEETKGIDTVDDTLQSPLVPTAKKIDEYNYIPLSDFSNYQHYLLFLS